ncbi:MAG: DUF1800 domain-containing protein [Candidatus Baltobacteraceae bacterium]
MLQTAAPSSYRPAGPLPDAPLEAYAGPWNVRLAAHLLRRAGFGGSPETVARFAAMPLHAAVDALVAFPASNALPEVPPDLPDESGLVASIAERVRAAGAQRGDPELVELMRQRRQLERHAIQSAQLWWLDRMIQTPAPLQEKMTLFWHGHFTTAAIEKGVTPEEAVAQNRLFRQYALGDVRELTQAVSRDPAMLRYLDNVRNTSAHPNENYARELMELFTLGIGNYTEQDVRESARAWTGLRVQPESGDVTLVERQHDAGAKTFLGRTGNFDGRDIVEIIFEQPAAARFLATKLLSFFVYSDPEPELVAELTKTIRRHDFALQPVMSTLLRSNVFYSARAYRALVKSPVEFVVGSYQLFGIEQAPPDVLPALARMNQVLFYPPNVKGWPGGAAWLNSQTVLARENFAGALMASKDVSGGASWLLAGGPGRPEDAARKLAQTILQGDVSNTASAELIGYLGGEGTSALGELSGENFEERMRAAAYLTMATPAYQLA